MIDLQIENMLKANGGDFEAVLVKLKEMIYDDTVDFYREAFDDFLKIASADSVKSLSATETREVLQVAMEQFLPRVQIRNAGSNPHYTMEVFSTTMRSILEYYLRHFIKPSAMVVYDMINIAGRENLRPTVECIASEMAIGNKHV